MLDVVPYKIVFEIGFQHRRSEAQRSLDFRRDLRKSCRQIDQAMRPIGGKDRTTAAGLQSTAHHIQDIKVFVAIIQCVAGLSERVLFCREGVGDHTG